MRMLWVGICGAAFLLAACGGDGKKTNDVEQPKPDDEEPTEEEINEMMSDTGLKFDEEAAKIVLKRGARKVNDCLKEGAVAGEGEITAIFDGPKGRIVEVELGYTFEDGTDQGKKCIKNAFIGEIIPPFEGKKSYPWNIKISEGGEPEEKKDEKKK